MLISKLIRKNTAKLNIMKSVIQDFTKCFEEEEPYYFTEFIWSKETISSGRGTVSRIRLFRNYSCSNSLDFHIRNVILL